MVNPPSDSLAGLYVSRLPLMLLESKLNWDVQQYLLSQNNVEKNKISFLFLQGVVLTISIKFVSRKGVYYY